MPLCWSPPLVPPSFSPLVPPAKLPIQITLYNFLSMSTNVQPRNTFVYDIGTKILYSSSFDHKPAQKRAFSLKEYRRNQLDEIYILAVSKLDVKRLRHFFEYLRATLDSQVPVVLGFLPQRAEACENKIV